MYGIDSESLSLYMPLNHTPLNEDGVQQEYGCWVHINMPQYKFDDWNIKVTIEWESWMVSLYNLPSEEAAKFIKENTKDIKLTFCRYE